MPTITDWLMVAITLVYVIATILICIFNFRSAKATREQVAEAKRQFEEENKAYITYSFLYERKTFFGVRLTNSGKKVANEVKIKISPTFIGSIAEAGFANDLRELESREFILGIGQNYDFFFGSNEYRENKDKVPLTGEVSYSDDKASYFTPISIDTANYATMYSVTTDFSVLLEHMEKQTKELAEIKGELQKLNCHAGRENIDE